MLIYLIVTLQLPDMLFRINNRVRCAILWWYVLLIVVVVVTIGSVITGMVLLDLKAESKITEYFHCLLF